MSEKMDTLLKRYSSLIRNVRPRELQVKLNDCVTDILQETEDQVRRNLNNPILQALRGQSNG